MDKQEIVRCFNGWAPGWDARLVVDSEKINRILDAADVRAASHVLDVGCGTGVLMPFYLERAVSAVLGVDMSSEMIRIAASKFDDPRLSFLCADAETMALDERFDRCVIFNAFPHMVDREALLRNLRRHLVCGGKLTVAHDRGRAALAAHHKSVGAISTPLPPSQELGALLRACGYTDIFAYEAEDCYIVSGRNEVLA